MIATHSAGEELREYISTLRKKTQPQDGRNTGAGSHERNDPVLRQTAIPAAKCLTRGVASPIVAVDCGMVKLGETPRGIVIALRAALVVDAISGTSVRRYFSGPLYLDNSLKTERLYELGKQLGQDDYYVEVDRTDPEMPRPIYVRSGVADNARHYADRFRSWFERKIQADACTAVQGGTVCLDSSLTLSTRDCPNAYLRGLVTLAHDHGNNVIAVSKMSELEVMGSSVRWWLGDAPPLPCYRALTPLMRQEAPARADRILGQVYAMRFAAFAPTAFRVDVCAAPGTSDDQAIAQFFGSIRVRGFYPDVLALAHMYATIPRSAVWSLQAQAKHLHGVVCRPDVSLEAAFGPFAGKFK